MRFLYRYPDSLYYSVYKKSILPNKKSKLSPLLEKHLSGIEYGTIFFHPQTWENGKYKKSYCIRYCLQHKLPPLSDFVWFQEMSTITSDIWTILT